MARVVINIPDEEALEIKLKAKSFGLTLTAYTRQVLKDSLRKKNNQEQIITVRAIRKLIPIFVEAFGRSQRQEQQIIDKLTQVFLAKYDQGVEP